MAQWVNRLRDNILVNPPPLPLFCEICGALHLAQSGLMAGRQAGWQIKYRQILKNSKIGCGLKYLSFHFV